MAWVGGDLLLSTVSAIVGVNGAYTDRPRCGQWLSRYSDASKVSRTMHRPCPALVSLSCICLTSGLLQPLTPLPHAARGGRAAVTTMGPAGADGFVKGHTADPAAADMNAAGASGTTRVSRRSLLRGALWATGTYSGSGAISCASAYTVDRVRPDERETYVEAQKGPGPLRVLWIGPGTMKGVSKGLFAAGNEVVALDLSRPGAADLSAAAAYATEHGYRLRFEQGDATHLKFAEDSFDVVVCSLFLCQDFNPEVVVSEIRRVLKPGGRFGFYEHVEDIDEVIVGKVFGERSIVRVQALPDRLNIIAGVVKKV